MRRALGVCYYPEHWPEEIWAEDASRMREAGLTWVRIGEFAWSRLEPSAGDLRFDWLERAIDTLGGVGLKVVLGTPTATPPRWMVERHPDMLAVDALGRPRGFGSRRHYCHSHRGYREESCRITGLLAERFGRNPFVGAWQTDNEYGCHDTVLSWSESARREFRFWLCKRFSGDIASLNRAWGNVFWSMEYAGFDEIDPPNLTVTEPNPAHSLAFRRFSSDQVVAFNRAQVEIIRARSDAPITHNYMGWVTDFDHFEVGADLDFASWDSYPTGFLEDRVGAGPERQRDYARQGDPDFQAFHHDLYRAVGRGRWWVMEQQPGPVNWAPSNPAPLPGMVRLWTWEAFAHGAEAVCYFRWRQVPFGQEQMHSGLLRPDSADAPGLGEVRKIRDELADAGDVRPFAAEVALIFDYDADRFWTVQPHGVGLGYRRLVFDHYRALRRAGLSVDILPSGVEDVSAYRVILAPGLMHMSQRLKRVLARARGHVLLGPRSGARDTDFAIPVPLPPAFPGLDVTVSRVESLRADMPVPIAGGGAVVGYREEIIAAGVETVLIARTGEPVAVGNGNITYMAGWGDDTALDRLVRAVLDIAGVDWIGLPDGVRIRDTGAERFWFNYNSHDVKFSGITLPAAGVLRSVTV